MLAKQCLQLPMHPALTPDQIDFVSDEVIGALKNASTHTTVRCR
jgi:dTDP-4-amino-4,6-dideoxygalactose transaminase